MSYHGGVIGVVLAFLAFTRAQKKGFFETFDLFIPSIPLGYTFGRLGIFKINDHIVKRFAKIALLNRHTNNNLVVYTWCIAVKSSAHQKS